MKKKTFTEHLPVDLTDQEKHDRAEELAVKIRKFDAMEEERKETAKRMKGNCDLARADIRSLATVVETGKEYREVECEWEANIRTKIMELYRLDTGECVKTRPMDKAEVDKYATRDIFDGVKSRPAAPKDAH